DRLTDDFMDERTSESNFGVDLGLLWHSDFYQVGATIYNINEPSFDYPDMNKYLDETALKAARALEAQGRLQLKQEVTLTRHAVLEAAAFALERQLLIQGSIALNEAENLIGDEHQYATLSFGYFTDSWFIPGIRVGYRKDLAGTELSTASLGLTLFGTMNIDASVGLEESSYDDEDYPRYLAFAIGFEEKF
ncbi:MAG: conjugal transfer protein TraF, partial [Desulfurivibrionaceae bacterium]|nr:conjugal transfer protein TraF [Desulfurivibrionaceae bacterium]